MHVKAKLAENGVSFDLNHLHLPTGWVLIEEVIRFIVTDLEFTPLCDDWETRIKESETRFYTEFSSKR